MPIKANKIVLVKDLEKEQVNQTHSDRKAGKMDTFKPPHKSYDYAVINGRERKLSKASRYILDMITSENP